MDSELQRLVDEAQIRDVLARCARAIDRMDWDLLRSCYHPGAVDDHGRYNGEIEGFVAWLEGEMPKYAATMHALAQSLIRVEGDVANSECCGVAWHRTADESQDRTVLVRYCDRLERRDGRWAIVHRRCVYEFARLEPVAAGSKLPDAYLLGSRDLEDPSYHPPVA